MNLRCRNIKINVILAQSLDLGLIPIKDFTITNKRTCFTLRHVYLDCVITIYKHSPTSLHITGIKSSSVITEVFEFLSNFTNAKIISSKINNSMFLLLCEVAFMRFTSSPPFTHQRNSVLCSTRNYA